MKLTLSENDDTVLAEATVTAAEWREAEQSPAAAHAVLLALWPGTDALAREDGAR